MNTEEISTLQNKYLIAAYAPEIALIKGQGCYVWDASGKKYLDFTSGISVCNLGHCHPVVTDAIQRQAATLVHVSNLYMNEIQPRLAEKIAGNSFGGKLFFANSGAEANEGMIKFARRWGSDKGKSEIVCMNQSFHGRTLATLAATDKPKFREGFSPHLDGFVYAPFNDIERLEQVVHDKTAAILLEPIQGEGGIYPADQGYLNDVRNLCDEKNILLLFDEIQCGMGRTGHYFAHQHFNVEPDAMSVAKALGNGFPIGAFEIREKWADVLTKGTHASTFGGTPLACSAALAVFDVIEKEDILFNCQKMSRYLEGKLATLAKKCSKIKELRTIGLMIGIECDGAVDTIIKEASQSGLLILSAGESVIRLLPPLVVTQTEIDAAIEVLEKIL